MEFMDFVSLCAFFFLMEFCLRPKAVQISGADKFRMDFLRISWISDGSGLDFYGIYGSGMDFHGSGMDLVWFFFGIHESRLDFHGSGIDFLWISWISGGFPWPLRCPKVRDDTG